MTADDETSTRAHAIELPPWSVTVSMVRTQMRSLVGPTRDLDDLTQVALEQLVRAIPRFEGRSALSTFTYRICVNVAMSHFRSFRRWLRRFTLDRQDADAPAPGPDVPEILAEHHRALQLHRLLDRLRAEYRIVVVLCDLEELPGALVSEILDVPAPTVRSRLRRGRLELAALLAQDPWFQAADEVTS